MKRLLLACLLFPLRPAFSQPPIQSQDIQSQDGRLHLSRQGETLRLTRAGHTLWSQKLDGPVDIRAVSRQGRVAVQKYNEIWILGPQGQHQHTLDLPDTDVRTVWFSEKGTGLYIMSRQQQVYYQLIGPAGDLFLPENKRVDESTLLRQFNNPECPKGELLLCTGWDAPLQQLEQLSGAPPQIRLALQAYHGDSRAAARLLAAMPQDSQACSEWLLAAQLGGPKVFQPALHQALNRDWTPTENGREPWDEVLGFARFQADPWLVQWLERKQATPTFERNLLRTLSKVPASSAALERLAASSHPEVAEQALRQLLKIPAQHDRLLRLLPRHPQPVLDYFQYHYYPPIVPAAIPLLSGPHRRQARRALHFQARIDLGSQPQAWRDWLKLSLSQRQARRLSQQGPGQQAQLLLKSQLGTLTLADFKASLRSLRLYPLGGSISADGRWFISDVGARPYWSLTSDQPLPVSYAANDGFRADLRSDQVMTWFRSSMSICQGSSGQPRHRWNFDPEQLGDPRQFVHNGQWVAFEHGLVDARTGSVLWNWPQRLTFEWMADPGDRILLCDEDEQTELWDSAKKVRLSLFPDTELLKSQDGQRLLQVGEQSIQTLNARLQPGAPSYPSGLDSILSPDGRHLVTLHDQRVDIFSGSAKVSLPIDASEATFSPDSQWLALSHDGQIELRRAPAWQPLARGGSDMLYLPSASFSQNTLCLTDDISQVLEIAPRLSQLPPPDQQPLFAELWTGKRLKGGLALALSPAQYDQRRRQWRQLCGLDWTLSPNYRAPQPPATYPWQVLLVTPLLGLWWALRRRQPFQSNGG
ncbi:hypothetical protein IV102_33735 [bacterium]|nr:hypothetical protein [bacterium]